MFFLGFILPGTLCFLDLVDYFLSRVQEVFSYHLFKYSLRRSLSLFSPSGTPLMGCWCVYCCPRGLWGCLHLCIVFHVLFCGVISTLLSSSSTVPSSASVTLLCIPSGVFFSSVYLSFGSSRSLANVSCIFSIVVSILFPEILGHLHDRYSELFFWRCLHSFPRDPGSSSRSLFWTLFLKGCLSPLHLIVFLGFYLVPSSGT